MGHVDRVFTLRKILMVEFVNFSTFFILLQIGSDGCVSSILKYLGELESENCAKQ